MRWRTRRRLALLILVVGLPVYVLLAAMLASLLPRPSFTAELAIYVGLGLLWIVPFRGLFRGISQPEPEEERRERTGRR